MQKKYIFEIQSVNNHLILDFGFQKDPLFHRHHQQSKISFLCLQTKLMIYHYFNSLLLMHSSRIASNTKFEPKYFPNIPYWGYGNNIPYAPIKWEEYFVPHCFSSTTYRDGVRCISICVCVWASELFHISPTICGICAVSKADYTPRTQKNKTKTKKLHALQQTETVGSRQYCELLGHNEWFYSSAGRDVCDRPPSRLWINASVVNEWRRLDLNEWLKTFVT